MQSTLNESITTFESIFSKLALGHQERLLIVSFSFLKKILEILCGYSCNFSVNIEMKILGSFSFKLKIDLLF